MIWRRNRTTRRLAVIGIVLSVVVFRWLSESAKHQQTEPAAINGDHVAGVQAIESAFLQRQSGIWVEAEGTIERLLADDTKGSRHQRFIVRLSPARTLLISHNIDLANRAPIAPGDTIAFRGKYEWNERGGVVHWTHRDPQTASDPDSSGGWLRVDGTTVR